jgi:hypothetical protein
MNRYLYAQANPATFIDPTGHDGFDPFGFLGSVATNTVNFGTGFVEGAVGSVVDTTKSLVDLAVATPGAVASAGGCALDSACRSAAVSTAQRSVASFVADPGKAVSRAWDAASGAVGGAVSSTVNRVVSACRDRWRTSVGCPGYVRRGVLSNRWPRARGRLVNSRGSRRGRSPPVRRDRHSWRLPVLPVQHCLRHSERQ